MRPPIRNKNMDSNAFAPMDDIKKLGEILMKRTSEKEYYRFLHIQEQCCLKWQTSIFKFGQLKKEHDKCKIIRAEMQAKLQNMTQLLLKERQTRRNAEMERDFYLQKMQRTYEFLRNQELDEAKFDKKSIRNVQYDGTNDEITSTGSFLSNLGDITCTDDDIHSANVRSNAANHENYANKLAIHRNLMEKTFKEKQNPNETLDDSEIESSSEVLSPSKRPKQFLHVSDDFTNAKLSEARSKRSFELMSSEETDSNPIYECIVDDDSSFLSDNKENNVSNREAKVATIETTEAPIHKVDSKSEVLLNPHNCQHNFAHRTALRSEVCFLCSKKFRFGILAFKCTNCKGFVHHDCKSQLKTSLKSRQLGKNGQKHCISDYVPTEGPSVPALIVHCVNEVEIRGLSERGIYRVSGSEKEIKALKERFLHDEHLPDLSNVDMHNICGCIKVFLRGLREPLIPTQKWAVFSSAVVDFDGDYLDGNILKNLQTEINQLPKANRDTLAFLVLHLQRVATCDAVKMPISNLAKVFGPTVVGYSKLEPDHTAILGETIIQQNVMEHFLNIPTDYWFSFISDHLSL